MKSLDDPTTIFDLSLTPENAHGRGYEYIEDVIYDKKRPSEAMKDILEFVQKFQSKLGSPKMQQTKDPFFGLYLPIEQDTEN